MNGPLTLLQKFLFTLVDCLISPSSVFSSFAGSFNLLRRFQSDPMLWKKISSPRSVSIRIDIRVVEQAHFFHYTRRLFRVGKREKLTLRVKRHDRFGLCAISKIFLILNSAEILIRQTKRKMLISIVKWLSANVSKFLRSSRISPLSSQYDV